MPICDTCGGAIEFRYKDGGPKPIHLDGLRCSGSGSISVAATSRPFAAVVSYVNPNAHCPVCGKQVFFHQSQYGGRVFFDDLGWPWPKHPCTDKPQSQVGTVRLNTVVNFYGPFKNAAKEPLDLYELRDVADKDGGLQMQFSQIGANIVFRASLPQSRSRELDITINDLRSAPSFVVRTLEAERAIEFISGRKKRIDRFTVTRVRKP